jgi:MFS family permease
MQPRFAVALFTAVASYALMSLVMTATPLAMVGHGHSAPDSQLAIQWHVIAMFAPSFFTGALIARLGRTAVAAGGLLLIAGAATVALTGTSVVHFWIALILLGVGWNFGFVAATAMLTELYQPAEAFKVQAVNDFIQFGIVALASFASGGVLNAAGWTAVNVLVYPVVLAAVGLNLALALRGRRQAQPG